MSVRAISFLLALALPLAAGAKPVNVVTSTPDLAWLVKEIGGELVAVESLLKGTENPHYVDAVPAYIRKVADAQMVCVIGLDLEIGWMPKVLARSGNSSVQPGGPGYCDVGKGVTVLEKPTGAINRSMGDVHPSGNPHYFLSPKAVREGAGIIAETLAAIDPSHAKAYHANLARTQAAIKAIEEKVSKHFAATMPKGKPLVMEYHRELTYFFDVYGFRSLGSLEEKPGVPPSAGRIATMTESAKVAGVKMIIAAPYSPHKTLERFSELSAIPEIIPPLSITTTEGPKDYLSLQMGIADAIVKALRSEEKGG